MSKKLLTYQEWLKSDLKTNRIDSMTVYPDSMEQNGKIFEIGEYEIKDVVMKKIEARQIESEKIFLKKYSQHLARSIKTDVINADMPEDLLQYSVKELEDELAPYLRELLSGVKTHGAISGRVSEIIFNHDWWLHIGFVLDDEYHLWEEIRQSLAGELIWVRAKHIALKKIKPYAEDPEKLKSLLDSAKNGRPQDYSLHKTFSWYKELSEMPEFKKKNGTPHKAKIREEIIKRHNDIVGGYGPSESTINKQFRELGLTK